MKYTKDEEFAEVMKRSKVFKLRHIRKTASVLSASASLIMVALVMAISSFGGVGAGLNTESAYGSFLLPTESGGYVLAAVIAFSAGICATLCVQKSGKTRKSE